MNSVRRTTQRNFMRVRRGGFTLLEMLVTAILSAVLLAGLWTLFNTYMRLFETGQIKTEQSQLVRALAQQIADDLRSVVVTSTAGSEAESGTFPDSPSTAANFAPPGANSDADSSANLPTFESRENAAVSKLPRFRLVGTLHALRLDALHPSADKATPVNDEFNAMMSRGNEHVPAVPELRTIVYSFEEERAVRDTDRKTPPGLLRVDFDWQEVLRRSGTSRRNNRATVSDSETAISESLDSLGLGSTATLELLADDSKMHVPEVVQCEFHYFDGFEWLEEWDSAVKNSLPRAVEVTLRLEPPVERWKPKPVEATESSRSLQKSKSATDERLPTEEIHRPMYRQIIVLASPPADGSISFASGVLR